ncbi:30S ribosomal protein S1 [Patescibacteria group bacterium]
MKKSKTPKNPKTMDDLLSAYGSTIRNFKPNDRVEGTVLSIDDGRMIVELGGKSEGIIAEKAHKEARDYIKTLKVGDKISAFVIAPQNYDGQVILSLRDSVRGAVWEKLHAAYDAGEPISVRGTQKMPSGLLVDVDGINGFVPMSLFGKVAAKDVGKLVGSTFQAIIVDLDQKDTKIVLSEKLVSEADEIRQLRKAIAKVKEKEIYDGAVTTVTNFGVFVTISIGKGKKKSKVDGLVHISELSWEKIDTPSSSFNEGDKVEVMVIGKEKPKKQGGVPKLSLSIKQATDDPWKKAVKKYKKDTKLKGKVTKTTDFGVFVSVDDGVEGLIHMTKIPPGKKLEKGDEVSVYVEEIDEKDKKLSLGIVLTAKPIGYR